jgi:hypothetical protein
LETNILEDRDRNLWLATTNDGLSTFDRKHQQFIRYRNEANNGASLADDQFLNIFQDREGNIWGGPEQVAPTIPAQVAYPDGIKKSFWYRSSAGTAEINVCPFFVDNASVAVPATGLQR